MNWSCKPLEKLRAAARKGYVSPSVPETASAPPGFSTRVAARWAAARRKNRRGDAWERVCWWGAGVSVAVCILAFRYQAHLPEPNAFDLVLEVQAEDPGLL